MKTNPSYLVSTWTIPPGEYVGVERVGEFLSCLDASAVFQIQIDNAPVTQFEQGLTYSTDVEYHSVRLINPNTEALTVRVGFGRGGIQDSRLTLGAGSDTVKTDAQSPDTLTTGAPVDCLDAAATLIAAANAARSEIIVTNSGAGKVFIQGAAGAAGEGIPLAVDQTSILSTTAAVHIRNDTGATVSVNVAEIEAAP